MQNQNDMITFFKENQFKAKLFEKFSTADVRLAKEGEVIQTILDGEVETVNTAKSNDVVIRGTRGEEYIMDKDKFAKRYDLTSKTLDNTYQNVKATGTCVAYQYQGEPMEFNAAWNEKMIIKADDWLATTDDSVPEVYRIEKQAFAETYKPSSPKKEVSFNPLANIPLETKEAYRVDKEAQSAVLANANIRLKLK